MSEDIYVLNENGSICGLKDRQYVHNNGTLHSAVQCWVMNNNGEILIQRRAATKDKSAGKWDVSFGGHCVKTNNTKNILIDNVIKEGKEELGLDIKAQDIIKLGEVRYTSQEYKNKELLGIFLIRVDNTQKFIFEDGEVSEIRWIKPDTLYDNILKNPKEYANRIGAITLLKLSGA
ncbi:MAG: NUDIX domain-containing protein [Alphaproteobacteria bacterium]|nr:NUDIX domain-containing protein [Alphaproteobacteria bacterium]